MMFIQPGSRYYSLILYEIPVKLRVGICRIETRLYYVSSGPVLGKLHLNSNLLQLQVT